MRFLALSLLCLAAPLMGQDRDRPNVVVILADDLGWAELGSYGQARIRTPHLDRLASEGLCFTQAYAGSAVCAPSRCVLLTGRHTGHAHVRNNSPWASAKNPQGEGQEPLPADAPNLARWLQGHGYATACVGKWGLGGPGTSGAPQAQGFDHFFGYLCQKQAHDYYPAHLWRNGEKVALDNPGFTPNARLDEAPEESSAYARWSGEDYAPDLMLDEALEFVDAHQEEPFFLYYATPVPHMGLQVPADSLAAYAEEGWDEGPYLGQRGYQPHPAPRAAYAAMVSRLDRDVGRLVARIDELGLAQSTLVVFLSDNGATYNGGTDSAFFQSSGGLRGRKGQLYEGGVRVPMIVRWPGRVRASETTAAVAGFQDLWPTCAALLGEEIEAPLDGVSLAGELLGQRPAAEPRALYWELGRARALRLGDLKLVETTPKQGPARVELFDLAQDPGEQHDLAAERPEDVARLRARLDAERKPSAIFPSPYDAR